MTSMAIRAENIAKLYRIGERVDARYKTMRDIVARSMGGIFRPFRKYSSSTGKAQSIPQQQTEFWALKDVSFEVRTSELVGIIGRNGAGKSTLLKILSRITSPTNGYAQITGRVASLLEVGTGFHPELTGRENIFLNGAILGMRRTEIARNFDEIVAFAEIEKFIDTPVKFYSSGMYVRLAFAVAAHLEPEILIVDEVLAVGDSRFQRKCLNKMQDVGQDGRTVLFVSHNMPAITRMCPRAILLNEGQVIKDGPAPDVVSAYLNTGQSTTAIREWTDSSRAPGGEVARLCAVRVRTEDGSIMETADIRRPVLLEMEYEVVKGGNVLLPHFLLYNEEGIVLFNTLDLDPQWRGKPRPIGRYRSTATIPGNFLTEGSFFVEADMITLDPVVVQFNVREAVTFQVIDTISGDSARGDWGGPHVGMVRPLLQWQTKTLT